MDLEKLENFTSELSKLSAEEQDHLAGFLLVERMKRNQLVMPAIHKRIEDADPENWKDWEKAKPQLKDV